MRDRSFEIFDKLVNLRLKRCRLERSFYNDEKFQIEYWSSKNSKPVLLLVHAFGAEAKYSWFKQVKLLSKHFRLIIPNMLFFGNSAISPPSYHIKDQVEAIKTMLDYLEVKKLSVGGASYGGIVVSELALTGQFEIEKLFMTNTPTKFPKQADWQDIIDDFGVNKKSEVLIPTNHKNLKKLFDLSSYRRQYVPEFFFRNIYDKLYMPNADHRRKLIETFVEEQDFYSERIYNFSFPVLLVWGKNDLLAPVSIGEDLDSHLGSSAKLIIMDKTGHMPNFERPVKFNKLLIHFLLDR